MMNILIKTFLQSAQIFSSFSLFGLIWVIQVVHYPAFKYVKNLEFAKFHDSHSKKISLIVIPLMIMELVSAIGLIFYTSGSDFILQIVLAIIVLAVWIATFFIQTPLHRQLSQGKNTEVIDHLIKTNWIRTFLWSLKALIILASI